MTTSASTPRLRLTLFWYLAMVLVTAVNRPTDWGPWGEALLGAGALLLVAAAVLGRIWCSVFIAGRKDAELVVAGPYALCRHPLYSLSLLGALGLGFASRSATLTLATLLLLGWLVRRAAIAEEAFLAARHGAAFAAYLAGTPRFLPLDWLRLGSRGRARALPASLEVKPPVLWKAFVDAGAFMLLWALVEAARALQSNGALPGWLALP